MLLVRLGLAGTAAWGGGCGGQGAGPGLDGGRGGEPSQWRGVTRAGERGGGAVESGLEPWAQFHGLLGREEKRGVTPIQPHKADSGAQRTLPT